MSHRDAAGTRVPTFSSLASPLPMRPEALRTQPAGATGTDPKRGLGVCISGCGEENPHWLCLLTRKRYQGGAQGPGMIKTGALGRSCQPPSWVLGPHPGRKPWEGLSFKRHHSQLASPSFPHRTSKETWKSHPVLCAPCRPSPPPPSGGALMLPGHFLPTDLQIWFQAQGQPSPAV